MYKIYVDDLVSKVKKNTRLLSYNNYGYMCNDLFFYY